VFTEANFHYQLGVILMKEECEGHSVKDIDVNQLNKMKILMHGTQYSLRMIKYLA
jgi:hypothetical protein